MIISDFPFNIYSLLYSQPCQPYLLTYLLRLVALVDLIGLVGLVALVAMLRNGGPGGTQCENLSVTYPASLTVFVSLCLAHLAVQAYSSSSISNFSNSAVCKSAIYRIYRAL